MSRTTCSRPTSPRSFAKCRSCETTSASSLDGPCCAAGRRCFPIECVVRGYLSGSAWKEYRERGTLAGESLPQGLRESTRLDPPLFSPATKAEEGHDENITVARMAELIGDRAGGGAGAAFPRGLRAGSRHRRRARNHHRRYQVRIRPVADQSGRRTGYIDG